MANISQIIKCEGDNNTFGLSVVCLGAVATGFNKTEYVGEMGGELWIMPFGWKKQLKV